MTNKILDERVFRTILLVKQALTIKLITKKESQALIAYIISMGINNFVSDKIAEVLFKAQNENQALLLSQYKTLEVDVNV